MKTNHTLGPEYHLAPIADYLNTYAREHGIAHQCRENIDDIRHLIDLLMEHVCKYRTERDTIRDEKYALENRITKLSSDVELANNNAAYFLRRFEEAEQEIKDLKFHLSGTINANNSNGETIKRLKQRLSDVGQERSRALLDLEIAQKALAAFQPIAKATN
jgi:chromosome segregation ATPase